MRKFMFLTAAAIALGVSVAVAQPKEDTGYGPRRRRAQWRNRAAAR
jgi:hypothetical protein